MPDLAVFYEHPLWFAPLFAALDARGIEYVKLGIAGHSFDPAGSPPPARVVLSRLAMSSFLRSADHAIFIHPRCTRTGRGRARESSMAQMCWPWMQTRRGSLR